MFVVSRCSGLRMTIDLPEERSYYCRQCPYRLIPLGRLFPTIASSVRSEAGGWVWCMKLKI